MKSAKEEAISTLEAAATPSLFADDALGDLRATLRLLRSPDFSLGVTKSACYPLLVNDTSPGGRALRKALAGYAGDLLREVAEAGERLSPTWASHVVEVAQLLRKHLGHPLTSRQYLATLVLHVTGDATKFLQGRGFSPSTLGDFVQSTGVMLPQFLDSLVADTSDSWQTNPTSTHRLAIIIAPSGELRVEVVDSWGKHHLLEEETVAPSGLILPDKGVFLPSEVQSFEELLNREKPPREEEFQEFFEAHPKWLFLLGEQYETLQSQLQLPPLGVFQDLGFVDGDVHEGRFYPDFLLKRVGLELWDVLDIKRADARLVTGTGTRRKFSSAVYEAAAQLREYAERLGHSEVRKHLREKYGITISRPIAIMIIGRDMEFKTLRERDTLKSAEGVRVYTYDDLRRLARHRTLVL